jgi:hypothetical protein
MNTLAARVEHQALGRKHIILREKLAISRL